jgi:hypothetical protein
MAKRIAIFLLAMAIATLALAQGKKEKAPTERSVSGVVTGADGTPLPGAVVQLKNLKTLQVRSFIARDKGEYNFQGLSMDVDYEFKAEWNGKSSDIRRLSSFDSHPSVTINLKIKP